MPTAWDLSTARAHDEIGACRTRRATVLHEARATRVRARATRMRSASVRGDTLGLIVQALAMRRARRFMGSSDAPEAASLAGLVSGVLAQQRICLACLAVKTARAKSELVRVLGRMANTIQISVDRQETCGTCGTSGPVYSLRRA
jgi:hypothetical protein